MRALLRILTALSVMVPSFAWAAERPTVIRGIRPLAMGDAFTALADDQNIFFYNPAGTVMRTGSMFNLVNVTAAGNTDLLDALEFVDDNKDKLTDFNDLPVQERIDLTNEINGTISKLEPYLQASLLNMSFLSGPIANRFHWGAGVFTQTEGTFDIRTEFAIPEISYDMNADVVVPVNLAWRAGQIWKIPGQWGLGGNLKFMRRGQMSQTGISTIELEDIETPDPQIANGVGLDLGLLYRPTTRWNVGLAAMDFMGTKLEFDALEAKDGFEAKPAREETIKTRWNLGFGWTPAKLGIGRVGIPTGNRLQLAMDIKDIANPENKVFFDGGLIADTAWKHVHLGAQYSWWFLRLRGGANQGYPTFGLGADLPFLTLDYTYYGDELGETAGTLERQVHMVSLTLGFGGKNTEARDMIKNRHQGEEYAEKKAKKAEQKEAAPAAESPTTETPAPQPEPVPVETVPAQP